MSMSAPCQQQTNVSRSAAHRDDAIHILSSVNTIHCLHNNDHQTLSRFKINFLVFQTPCSDLIFSLFWLRHWICQELKESQSVSVRSFDDR